MSAKPTKKPRIPKLRVHKASGQGYVALNGRWIYLGEAGKPETLQQYNQVIGEWLAAGRQPAVAPEQITVKELLARFWRHAEQYYRDGQGRRTSQLHVIRLAAGPLKALYGDELVTRVTPLALKAVREQMVQKGWARTTVNHAVGIIKQISRWGVENELVQGETYHALQAVAGLRRGRCEARESEPVRPVPGTWIDALKPYVSRQVWALIQLQLLTGARAGELVGIRPCDLDTTGRVWMYSPAEHKTAHHGHQRVIYLGPRAPSRLGR